MSKTERAIELAREAGFDLAGISPCTPPPDAARFESWLDHGYHAGLDYLAADRERIVDPRRLLPSGKSILVVGFAHSRPAVDLAERGIPGGGRVARYAAGRDYHNRMLKMLRKLARGLKKEGLGDRRRPVADAGPVLERSHAARAGIGFLSKAANLLHPRFGPWFFLGELLIDSELEPTPTPPKGSCGTCRLCIDACPTSAILEPGLVDAGKCLSYHSIESHQLAPREIRERTGPWAFGCDVCSEVCPWGRAAPDTSRTWGDSSSLVEGGLLKWLAESEARPTWADATALRRPGPDGLARNAAIALAAQPSEVGREGLLRALASHASPMVRASAAWSLGRAHRQDSGVRAALETAADREPDPEASRDMRLTLDQAATQVSAGCAKS
ncbi:MAG TPA: tRNA epoxyqueuosine(34) reductase QueG [Planctomycetota bacterium]|nr:tRNA epoxyqueuosine(34) reductase QueG [Planctomycetota bacterium]